MGELTEGRGQTWKMSDLFQMFLCEIRVKDMTGNMVAVLFRGSMRTFLHCMRSFQNKT